MNKFEGTDGKVIFFSIEEVKHSYEKGTLKLEVKIYPASPGSYSSFIYTEVAGSYKGVILKCCFRNTCISLKGTYGFRF